MSWSRSVASAPARHSLRLAVSAALLATPAWSAQLPTLVKDINQISYGDLGSGPLAHAHPLTRGGHPHAPPYVKVGGRFYFSAATLPNGRELYVSDGTANGTRMVKDIFPGRGDSFRSSPSHFERSSLMAVGSRVFFMANDGTHGYELWVSDGTLSGTRMIRDIQPGTGSSFPTLGGALAGKLYFSADNGVNGAELWVSDGTTRGTVMLRDIGPKQSSSGPGNFTVFRTRLGRKLYFAATGSNGRELWVTDGTPKGTFELRNIGPGSLSSNPTYFLQIGSRLFFQARGASSLPSLWVTDGSALGTREVRPQTFVYPTYFVALNGKLIFSAMGANGAELWISDGTANGTFELKDIRAGRAGSLPRHMTALGSQVFFTANDGLKGTELWVTDGTPQGTVLAADINDPGSSVPRYLTTDPTNKKLYFRAFHSTSGIQVWVYDTAAKKASLVKALPILDPRPNTITVLAPGKIVFSASDGKVGAELWESDGTAAGTKILKNIRLPAGETHGAGVGGITEMNGLLYFRASDDSGSPQLWASDGTKAGTQMLKEFGSSSYPLPPWPSSITRLGNKLIFGAPVGSPRNVELWESNGTAQGTRMLKEIRSGRLGSNPSSMFRFGNQILFQAEDGTHGSELWITDGTPNGTRMVKNIRLGPGGSYPKSFAVIAGKVVFQADDGINGSELWETDGTEAGTKLLKDIRKGSLGSGPVGMTEYKAKVFFSATDSGTTNHELWVTDGTDAGTKMLKEIHSGPNGSFPSSFAELGGLLYFSAVDLLHGMELWVTDGTVLGTKMAFEIQAGLGGSGFGYKTAVGSRRLYFGASDGSTGGELWQSDGTLAGTRRLGDMNPGEWSFFPFNISEGRPRYVVLNDHLYFTGDDGYRGTELWKFKNGATAHPVHEDCKTHVVSMRATDPVLGGTLRVSGSTGITRPIVVLALGFRARLASSLGNGCLSYLDLGLGFQVLMATGLSSWTFSVPVPSNTSLSGARVAIQAWTFPPTFAFNQVELSNAVTLTLGN